MAICNFCNQDMSAEGTITCTGNAEVKFPDGSKLQSLPYNPNYGDENQTCHDCNIKRGGNHHPGCDMEGCPKCALDSDVVQLWKGVPQLISCGHLDIECTECGDVVESDNPDMKLCETCALEAENE